MGPDQLELFGSLFPPHSEETQLGRRTTPKGPEPWGGRSPRELTKAFKTFSFRSTTPVGADEDIQLVFKFRRILQ